MSPFCKGDEIYNYLLALNCWHRFNHGLKVALQGIENEEDCFDSRYGVCSFDDWLRFCDPRNERHGYCELPRKGLNHFY